MDNESVNSLRELELINPKYDSWDRYETYNLGEVIIHHNELYESAINDNLGNEPGVTPSWNVLL